MLCAIWATAFALVYARITHYRPGTVAIWIGVMSHWLLDWITHGPDMPLYPGGPRLGLGLWNSILGTMLVEFVMFGAGIWLYVRATRARDRVGLYAFLAYVVLLLATYVGDILSAPPTSLGEIAWPGLIAGIVMLLWAWWFDRHRVAREKRAVG